MMLLFCWMNSSTSLLSQRPCLSKRHTRPLHAINYNEQISEASSSVNSILNALTNNTVECLQVFRQYYPHSVDKISFGTLMKAYARVGMAEEAELLLQDQMHLWETTQDSNLQPDRISFTTVIDAWSRSGRPEASDRSEKLLERLQQLADSTDENSHLQPDVVTFTSVISACSDPWKAQAMLDDMWDRHVNHGGVKPNVRTYASVISCWTKVKTKTAALKADELLQSMRARFLAGDTDMEPNSIIYNAVLNSWAKSGAKDAPERIETWLKQIDTKQLDSSSFNVAISTWSKSGRPEAVERVERLVDRMFESLEIDPDIVTYSCLMDLYARTKQAQKATQLLYRVCDAYSNGISTVPPNAVVFATVISAWSKCKDPTALSNAEAVFRRMKQMQVLPTTVVYNALLTVWGTSRDPAAVEKTTGYLHEMKDMNCSPDVITYTAVLNALSTSKDSRMAVVKAYEMLDEMRASKIEPDLIIYSIILNVLSKSNDRDALPRALIIMGEIKTPNRICYNCLLKCVSRSRKIEKAQQALDILRDMEATGVEPGIITWNEVLAACAYSEKFDRAAREKAFTIAQHILDRIPEPSSHTYSHFFQAAAGLGQEEWVERAYDRCKQQGFHRDKHVLRTLKLAAPHLVS